MNVEFADPIKGVLMKQMLDHRHCTVIDFPRYRRVPHVWVRVSPSRRLYWSEQDSARYGQGVSPSYFVATFLAVVNFIVWNYLSYEVRLHLPSWTLNGFFR